MDGVIVHGRSIPDPSIQVRIEDKKSNQIKDRTYVSSAVAIDPNF